MSDALEPEEATESVENVPETGEPPNEEDDDLKTAVEDEPTSSVAPEASDPVEALKPMVELPEATENAQTNEEATEKSAKGDDDSEDDGVKFDDDDDSDEDDVVVTIGEIRRGYAKLDPNVVPLVNGKPIYDVNPNEEKEKPWLKPGANITDYFNFGFDEQSWNEYAEKQRLYRLEYPSQADVNRRIMNEFRDRHGNKEANAAIIQPVYSTSGRNLLTIDPFKQPVKIGFGGNNAQGGNVPESVPDVVRNAIAAETGAPIPTTMAPSVLPTVNFSFPDPDSPKVLPPVDLTKPPPILFNPSQPPPGFGGDMSAAFNLGMPPPSYKMPPTDLTAMFRPPPLSSGIAGFSNNGHAGGGGGGGSYYNSSYNSGGVGGGGRRRESNDIPPGMGDAPPGTTDIVSLGGSGDYDFGRRDRDRDRRRDDDNDDRRRRRYDRGGSERDRDRDRDRRIRSPVRRDRDRERERDRDRDDRKRRDDTRSERSVDRDRKRHKTGDDDRDRDRRHRRDRGGREKSSRGGDSTGPPGDIDDDHPPGV